MPESLGKSLLELGTDNRGLKSGLAQGESMAKASAQRMKSLGQKLTLSLTLPITLLGAGLVKVASDATEMNSQFNVVFGNMTDTMNTWAKTQAEALGRSETSLKEYLSGLQDTFVPMGFARDQAATLSKAVTVLGLDLSSFKNRNPEEVFKLMTSAMVGNNEAVRSLGINITEHTIKQELLRQGFKGNILEATQQQKALARLNIMFQQTKDAQGDLVRTNEELTNKWRSATDRVKEIAISFGELLLPAITRILSKGMLLLDWLDKLEPSTKKFILALGALIATIGPLITALGILGVAISALGVKTAIATAGITAAVGILAAWGVGLLDTARSVNDLEGEIKSLKDSIEELDNKQLENNRTTRGYSIQRTVLVENLKALEKELEESKKKTEGLTAAEKKASEILKGLLSDVEKVGRAQGNAAKSTKELTKEIEKQATATLDLANKTKSLFQIRESAVLSDAENEAILAEARNRRVLDAQKADEKVIKSQEKVARKSTAAAGTFSDGWNRASREYIKDATNMANLGKRVFEDLAFSAERSMSQIFFDGMTNKFKGLKDIVKDFGRTVLKMLADIAAQAAVAQVLKWLLPGGTGAVGTPGGTPGIAAGVSGGGGVGSLIPTDPISGALQGAALGATFGGAPGAVVGGLIGGTVGLARKIFKFADGGFAQSAQMGIVGEGGGIGEAILPLSSEKTTSALATALAKAGSAGGGTGTTNIDLRGSFFATQRDVRAFDQMLRRYGAGRNVTATA